MRKKIISPTVVRGVRELDRLSNLYYKSRDEKHREEWFSLV